MSSVIPNNNSLLQHTLAKLTAEEIAQIDWQVILHSKKPDLCATKFLPYIAWENSIGDEEGWRFAETDEVKRKIIKNYVEKHQAKGTPAVIRRLFKDLRLGEIEIIERAADLTWNGTANFDGKYLFGGQENDWAYYGIVIKRVVTVYQAELIKQILKEITPARCQLLYLDYRANALMWDGEINFDGNYTFGAIT